jgi:hypothetical protein
MREGPDGNRGRSVVLFTKTGDLDVGVIDNGSALIDKAD